jgi:hypothetical protein
MFWFTPLARQYLDASLERSGASTRVFALGSPDCACRARGRGLYNFAFMVLDPRRWHASDGAAGSNTASRPTRPQKLAASPRTANRVRRGADLRERPQPRPAPPHAAEPVTSSIDVRRRPRLREQPPPHRAHPRRDTTAHAPTPRRRSPVRVTEMSWASAGPASPSFTVDVATQNAYLVSSWDTMLACQRRWNLRHVLWFALQDLNASVLGQPDYWEFGNGLLTLGGSSRHTRASSASLGQARSRTAAATRARRPAVPPCSPPPRRPQSSRRPATQVTRCQCAHSTWLATSIDRPPRPVSWWRGKRRRSQPPPTEAVGGVPGGSIRAGGAAQSRRSRRLTAWTRLIRTCGLSSAH